MRDNLSHSNPSHGNRLNQSGSGLDRDNMARSSLQKDFQQQQAMRPVQKKENNTGLPDNLKNGIENLSGYSMDDVNVHYNSDKPAQLNAHAYAQGSDIHIASGQEKHLSHEAWHVIQQKQGRVKPTMQMKRGVDVNDDKGLEQEADEMGGKAIQMSGDNMLLELNSNLPQSVSFLPDIPIQRAGKVIQLASKEWMKKNGFRSTLDVIGEIEQRFASGRNAEAHALLKEYNDLTPNVHQKIKISRIQGYVPPVDREQQMEVVKASGERRYLKDEEVTEGDLVYGLSERRDPYVDSREMQDYNVIDDLNNQFIGTKGGDRYGIANVPGKTVKSRNAAKDFSDFLKNFKPGKSPEQTPEGDEASINTRLRRASKYGISFTRENNNKVRFVLDKIDQDQVVNKTNEYDIQDNKTGGKIRAITGAELRYIYRNRQDKAFMDGIEFYENGHKIEHAPWEQNPDLWLNYVPKNENDIKSSLIRAIELNIHRVINSLPSKELKDSLRSYGRDYVAAFMDQFDQLYAHVELQNQETYDEVIEENYIHFISLIKG